jgi:thioredoxin reductase
MKPNPTVVIGAGPYGLAVAAHLRARDIPVIVLGKPMEFWRRMPAGLCLKSAWSASSLADPSGAFSITRYAKSVEPHPGEPIPLPYFLRYARWFQDQVVPDVDPTYVRSLSPNGEGFHVELADGRVLTAGRVVVAVGISAFAHIPDFARSLPASVCSHTQAHADYGAFAGRAVAVVGTGQSALESAALLHEAGADVDVIIRGQVTWVNRRLYDLPGLAKRIFYPPTDVGPPGINWVVAFPLMVRHFPARVRSAMFRRSVRPAGAKWLRPRVEGRLRITASAPIRDVTPRPDGVRITLGDGTTRDVHHLVLGTGYRPNLARLGFLEAALQRRLEQRGGFPVLNRWFESSVPGLHFVGGMASFNFGPLCNFMCGARVAARQIAGYAARA